MPHIPPVPVVYPNNFAGPHGFPLWVRYCHFFNFLFVTILIRSGLSILADHPRLYFNDDCTPGSEWIRFTPIKVPRDRLWTAKDDARYLSPIIGTPGYRHTIGIARAWHFIDVHGFILCGLVFCRRCSLTTDQWKSLVPTSPPGTPSGMEYMGPLRDVSSATGTKRLLRIQRAATDRLFCRCLPVRPAGDSDRHCDVASRGQSFPWYARIFGGRQSARSIHFLTMLSFLAFIVVHITLVVMTGFARNMNHIVLGTDDRSHLGMGLGFVGIGVVVLCWIAAHYFPGITRARPARAESRDLPDAVGSR